MDEFLKIIKNISLFGLIIGIWTALSLAFNNIQWNYFTTLLAILYNFLAPLNFIIDINFLYVWVGYRLSIDIAFMLFSIFLRIVLFSYKD